MRKHATRKITCPSGSALYRGFASCYDPIFKTILSERIQRTIRSLEIESEAKILDVGVGTGHYLTAYPKRCRVVGVDLSQAMLDVAARKIEKHGLQNIELRRMDALDLQFSEDSFDYVMGFHTASVVGDAPRMVREMLRVCRPGGRIVIINHFRTEQPWLAPFIEFASPLTRRLGWRTDVRCDDLFDGSLVLVEKRFKTSPISLFTVVVGRKPESSVPTCAPSIGAS